MNDTACSRRAFDQRVLFLEEALDSPSPNEAELLAQLHELGQRFAAERLQLAVIGQFKRGKSSLLNALIGEDVLPSGVLPVTALATWLEPGEPGLLVRFGDGREQVLEPSSPEEMQAALRLFVSESGNPHNRQDVREVHARFHAPLLDAGVVLLDTPGVGSTLEHNSRAAEAALPDADVALFVLSPDPPITPVEIDYLKAASEHAARLIIVLNKCDLLSNGERQETVAFARDAIRTKAGLEVEEIVCVSARAGLLAKKAGDPKALERSGLSALEQKLILFAERDKQVSLAAAVAKKSARLIASLQLENEVALRALQLPLDQLATCADRLRAALDAVDAERQHARDLLLGDRRRLVGQARAMAEEEGARIEREIMVELDGHADTGEGEQALAHALLEKIAEAFERAFPPLQERVAQALSSTLERHVEHAGRIAESIRSAAADVLGIELGGGAVAIEAELDLKQAWYDRRVESLAPVPASAIDAVLPRPLRARRAKIRVERDLKVALVRNVEKVRWSLQQAIEASVRSFQAQLDRQLEEVRGATADAVDLALQRRRDRASDHETQIRSRERLRVLFLGLAPAAAASVDVPDYAAQAPEDA
jgi:GTPase SAR1 family protein